MAFFFITRQSTEFCRHNPLCCLSTSVCFCCCLSRYRLSPETYGYTFVYGLYYNKLKSPLRIRLRVSVKAIQMQVCILRKTFYKMFYFVTVSLWLLPHSGATKYNSMTWLTPCSKVLQKPIITQQFKKFPQLLWNPNVHTRVYKSPLLPPVLIHMYPVQSFQPYFPKIHLNNLPSTPRSSKLSLPLRFSRTKHSSSNLLILVNTQTNSKLSSQISILKPVKLYLRT
jgi:hypothetical protein